MRAGGDAVIDVGGLDRLIVLLGERGYRTVGPVARDRAIVHGELDGADDLPAGWHDTQAPGRYRLDQSGDAELFGWAVGPASWKSAFFVPEETVFRASGGDGAVSIRVPPPPERPLAIVGARPCELAGLSVLDRVLDGGAVPDDRYAARRAGAVIIAVECGKPSSTCFCTSMDTGPAAGPGYDLALTELLSGAHRFYVQVGTDIGAELLEEVGWTEASQEDREARQEVISTAQAGMGRSLQTEGLAALLARNLDHPRWDEVAERCLSCGNCTLVCPTCFCSDVNDVSEVDGTVERRRTWASCFDVDHSYLHGGAVRPTTSSRYRQWLTHKLSTWWDQFDTSGCVGCGRCVTWCPVGIDITEEAAAIRATDGAGTPAGES
ncbi:MAG: 4Fe-4S dicluster domain-containing protein [Acidimicrobiales bacterium]